jgi:hypothetical protein
MTASVAVELSAVVAGSSGAAAATSVGFSETGSAIMDIRKSRGGGESDAVEFFHR